MALDENKKRSVQEFFGEDPEKKANKEFFGRGANLDRRGFLKRTWPVTMAS